MQLKCLIIDDEAPARRVIENYLLRFQNLIVQGSVKNAIVAMEFLKSNEVDVIFLDINMPKMSGMTLLSLLKTPPIVVITTAYTEHAVESYDYNVADYLLKPIRFERFAKAIEKITQLKEAQFLVNENKFTSEYFETRVDGYPVKLTLTDILYCQSLGNYIKLITDTKSYVFLHTTKELEEQLPKSIFVRTHKSFIVNIKKVSSITTDSLVVNSVTIPIGKTFRKYLSERLKSS